MDIIGRVSGVVLLVVAVVVAVHTVIEPLYHTSTAAQPYSVAWNFIDPLMALGIVLGVIFGYLRKSRAEGAAGTAITWARLSANAQFYGFLFVGIIFFWNWANLLSPNFTAVGDDATSLAWIIIDAGLPLLSGAMGVSLLRNNGA